MSGIFVIFTSPFLISTICQRAERGNGLEHVIALEAVAGGGLEEKT